MALLTYSLYDTAPFGVTADTLHTLFQVSQGADATHTKNFTNSRGAGQLPTEEEFTVDRIGVFLDVAGVLADIEAIWLASYIEIRIADETVLQVPLVLCAEGNGYGGHFELAAAAAQELMGRLGSGYKLDIPINIPGGTAFRVDVLQGTAVSAANTNVKVNLHGKLNRR